MFLLRRLIAPTVLATILLCSALLPTTTDVSAQGAPTFDMTTPSTILNIVRGRSASFDITVINTGKANITIAFNCTGGLSKYATFSTLSNKTIALTPGANKTVTVTVTPDKWIDTGSHELNVIAANTSSNADQRAIAMTVKVSLPKDTSTNPGLFLLALLPLIIVLIGIAGFKQSGTTMAFVGLFICIVLAVAVFRTDPIVALQASGYGFVKSFGISVAVIVTMYMIFLMGEMGLLKIISSAVKKLIVGKENMALFIGIGFGSFLTCLGVVTPALFPPVLIALGFSPSAAVAISVLGYNATTSFALLSIPITLPAQIGGIDPIMYAYKISIFLPVISVGIAITILWMLGGKKSVIKGLPAALVSSLALAFACLGFSYIDLKAGTEVIPISLIGVLAGLISMAVLLLYQKIAPPKADETEKDEKSSKKKVKSKDKSAKADKPKDPVYTREQTLKAFSPWIILTILAAIVSIPAVATELKALPGDAELITVWQNKAPIDLDVFNQIYFWIFISIIITIVVLRPTKEQLGKSFKTWLKRAPSPFLAYSIYFCIAYVMAYSAYSLDGSNLVKADDFNTYNMNTLLGATLAIAFGAGYIFVAAGLGLFGAVVGGSETSSNVMFFGIQQTASVNTGLKYDQFLTIYGAHAAAGGVASAITPAKINNAVSTIGETSKLESAIMRKHMVVTILMTIVTSLLTGLFVMVGL